MPYCCSLMAFELIFVEIRLLDNMVSNSNYKSPLVCVLMAVNKVDGYLIDSINSILKQSFTDFEFLIICNGGQSTEIKNFIESNFSDDRIVLCDLVLQGLAFSLNFGINFTNAKYIARQDSDDISLPCRLESQVNFLENNPEYGVVGCRVNLINADGLSLPDKFPFVEADVTIRKILPIHNPLCHPALIFRRDILLKMKGFTYGYFSEDHDLFLRMIRDSNTKFYNLPDVLFCYRRHGAQLTGQNTLQLFSEVSPIYFIHFLKSGNLLSMLGVLWVCPPMIILKRSIRYAIRVLYGK